MPAPDPWTFEDNVVTATVAGLVARGVPAANSRGQLEQPPDRVEVVASGFARASNQMAYTISGQPFHNHFAGTLTFTVITQRGGPAASAHGRWVGTIRKMMMRPTQFFTAQNLPAYEVLRLTAADEAPDENAPTDSDRTTLSFALELGVLGSAVSAS